MNYPGSPLHAVLTYAKPLAVRASHNECDLAGFVQLSEKPERFGFHRCLLG